MTNTLLTLLLSLQLTVTSAPSTAPASLAASPDTPVVQRLWWGLIDPELSAWFARLPLEEDTADEPILWDWSWRGFLAALFGQPMAKEAHANASAV